MNVEGCVAVLSPFAAASAWQPPGSGSAGKSDLGLVSADLADGLLHHADTGKRTPPIPTCRNALLLMRSTGADRAVWNPDPRLILAAPGFSGI